MVQGERVLCRFYLRTADRAPWAPTHERLLKAARYDGLAGATVFRGILGYGSHGMAQTSAWSLTQPAPVIVEIVDDGERIVRFLKSASEKGILSGLVTLERAGVMMYRPHSGPAGSPMELGALVAPLSTLPRIEMRDAMRINENGILLRVFIGESDRHEQAPLYEAIVRQARELGLAGATVLRGIEGFGANSVVHRASLLEMSADLPIVVEMVDTEPNIRRLLPFLETAVGEGMITMEHVVILRYAHREEAKG